MNNNPHHSMSETDKNYTMIQMVEVQPKNEGHGFEEPFDEEFWMKASHVTYATRPSSFALFIS